MMTNDASHATIIIRQILEENRILIRKIMDYQRMGKTVEAAGFQKELELNLDFLARTAAEGGCVSPSEFFRMQPLQQPVGQGETGVSGYIGKPNNSKGGPQSKY